MTPLTVRSHYSLMWGTAPVKDLVRAAKNLGYTSLALTDTDNLYGLWPFLKACRLNGVRPIVGAEVTEPAGKRRAVCLVENREGYKNLCRLLTKRRQDPGFDLETAITAHAPGLIVLTSQSRLLARWYEAGAAVRASLPRRPQAGSDKARLMAKKLGLPIVAVPGSFFIEPGDYHLHRVLRAIALNTSLSRLGPMDLAPRDAWLAPPEEYQRRFAIYPEAVAATRELAERLTFEGPSQETVMPPWNDPHGRPAAEVLRQAAYEGARSIYGNDLSETVVNRLEHELALIELKHFSSYFLVVRDIILRSPRICGRGSGAASLVAYSLGITNVCPIKNNLYFERFINADRKDPPDIDVDFAWDERDDVLFSVLEQYRGRSALVSNHVMFQPRMAIREVAKVYGLMEREINEVARRLPWFWRSHDFRTDLKTKIFAMPETKALEFPEPWPEIIDLAQRLVGTPRYLSVHPGGVIITPGPIDEYVPVEKAPKGVPIVQWEKDGSEEAGLVKIDLLGNRSLGVIRDAISNIRANGLNFDETSWEPEDDPQTQEAVALGLTMGCFYIESPATRLLQRKTRKGDFAHLVIHSSIIRPAANEFIREYIHRLNGGSWEPIHPLLEDVLDETLGVMVFQEDVSRTAVALGGFSHADADGLRKIMSKKDKERELKDYRVQFEQGARAKGVSPETINAVWDMMLSFSGYSFCKPHSASYARVSFQAAYLKAHHPAEFMAAVISNQGGFYSTFAYVSEARRLGLKILPPDVNLAQIRWQGQNKSLGTGLMSIKGLSQETQNRIIRERAQTPFQNLDDFLDRVNPDEREARALIQAGALDSLAPDQDHAFFLWKLAQKRKGRNDPPGPARFPGLFSGPEEQPAPFIPQGRSIDRLRREYAVLGFLTGGHPMVLFKDRLADRRIVKAVDLPDYVGRRIFTAGWLLTGKLIKTKKGDPMQFLTFEDETAIYETTFFPKAYEKFCQMLDWGRPYILSGRVEEDFSALSLSVDSVRPVEKC